MTQAKLQSIVKLITVIATVFSFVLICIVVFQYAKMGSLSAKNASLDKQIESLSITEQELRDGINRRGSDAYIEQQAREQLGMIEENGETVYVVK